MNIELLHKLYAAGFPNMTTYCPVQHKHSDEKKKKSCEIAYFVEPTLDELVAGCGDVLLDAHTPPKHSWAYLPSQATTTRFEGETPAEAVANVWLVLNKKS